MTPLRPARILVSDVRRVARGLVGLGRRRRRVAAGLAGPPAPHGAVHGSGHALRHGGRRPAHPDRHQHRRPRHRGSESGVAGRGRSRSPPTAATAYVAARARLVAPVDLRTGVVGIADPGPGPGQRLGSRRARSHARRPYGLRTRLLRRLGPADRHANTQGRARPIPVGRDPRDIVVTPNGRTVYVTSATDSTVARDRHQDATRSGASIRLASLRRAAIAVTPDSRTVYVTSIFAAERGSGDRRSTRPRTSPGPRSLRGYGAARDRDRARRKDGVRHELVGRRRGSLRPRDEAGRAERSTSRSATCAGSPSRRTAATAYVVGDTVVTGRTRSTSRRKTAGGEIDVGLNPYAHRDRSRPRPRSRSAATTSSPRTAACSPSAPPGSTARWAGRS